MARFLSLALVLVAASSVCADDWLAWRGPRGDGHAENNGRVPLKWSKSENVKWRVPLDGPGNSTPIVVGKRVFITHSPKESEARGIRCYDRETGELLWKQEVVYPEPEPTHNTNPYCSASPVSDGKMVIAWYGSAGLHAYDLEGNELWRVDTGKVEHIWGYGSSPLLYDDLVVQMVGPGLNAYVAAYEKKTGKEVWRKDYPGLKSTKIDEFRGTWSTPVVYKQSDGKTVLLINTPGALRAVDPASGDERWSCEGPSLLFYTSPIATENVVVAMCGYGGPALAVTSAGEGDITESNRLWIHPKGNPQRVGSGVALDGHIYILNENGVALCLDAKTGEKKWDKRLNGGASWSSMTLVGDRLYVPAMSGKTFVLAADPTECRVLAENDVGEMTRGSLAVAGDELFLRTYEGLYCLAEAK